MLVHISTSITWKVIYSRIRDPGHLGLHYKTLTQNRKKINKQPKNPEYTVENTHFIFSTTKTKILQLYLFSPKGTARNYFSLLNMIFCRYF